MKLGPGDVSQSIESLQASIKENDGVLDLASGAKAKLVSVEILSPGTEHKVNSFFKLQLEIVGLCFNPVRHKGIS